MSAEPEADDATYRALLAEHTALGAALWSARFDQRDAEHLLKMLAEARLFILTPGDPDMELLPEEYPGGWRTVDAGPAIGGIKAPEPTALAADLYLQTKGPHEVNAEGRPVLVLDHSPRAARLDGLRIGDYDVRVSLPVDTEPEDDTLEDVLDDLEDNASELTDELLQELQMHIAVTIRDGITAVATPYTLAGCVCFALFRRSATIHLSADQPSDEVPHDQAQDVRDHQPARDDGAP